MVMRFSAAFQIIKQRLKSSPYFLSALHPQNTFYLGSCLQRFPVLMHPAHRSHVIILKQCFFRSVFIQESSAVSYFCNPFQFLASPHKQPLFHKLRLTLSPLSIAQLPLEGVQQALRNSVTFLSLCLLFIYLKPSLSFKASLRFCFMCQDQGLLYELPCSSITSLSPFS